MKTKFPVLHQWVAVVLLSLAMGCTESWAQTFSLNSITNNGSDINPIGLRFDEPVTLPSATNVANYTVNAGTVIVTNVVLQADNQSVELDLDTSVEEFFSVSVSNVMTVASNNINATLAGFMSAYFSTTVGVPDDPDPTGQVFTAVSDSFDVTVGGSGVGDTNDYFHFIYQEAVGDFDVHTLVTRLDAADPLSQAGLMARESLTPGSPTVQTYFTPIAGSNEVQVAVRSIADDITTDSGFQIGPRESATPLRWLRITRTNDIFTAYSGTNGFDWELSGVTTQAFSTNLLVGLMVASHANGTATTASFSDSELEAERPGDTIIPTLGVSLSSSNLTFNWTRTPRDFTLEISSNLVAWSLLLRPVVETSATTRSLVIPISSLSNPLFARLLRVDRLIPIKPGIVVSPGIILSPGSGLSGTSVATNTFCTTNLVDTASVYKQTSSNITIPAGSIGDFNTTPSDSSVDTVMQLRNSALATRCDDDAAGNLKSRVYSSAFTTASGNFTFLTAAKAHTNPTAVIKVRINY